MLKIKLKDIVKIQRLEMELFEIEDDDYVDYRSVRGKERAIYNRLEKITDDTEKQKEIRDCIYKNMWNNEGMTFKPICDALRNMGYEVME